MITSHMKFQSLLEVTMLEKVSCGYAPTGTSKQFKIMVNKINIYNI